MSQEQTKIYASFKQKFLAFVIDTLIFILPSMILIFNTNIFKANDLVDSLEIIIQILVYGYNILLVWKFGATIGKMVMKIKVIDEKTQKPPGLFKSILREIPGKWLSSVLIYMGYFSMLWSDKKQTWHDKITGTVVVKSKT